MRSFAFRRRRGTSGFTLIELIVVVIIITVLAAIGTVAYNQYAAKARDTELVASATNIAHAITAKAAQDDLTTDAEAASVWPDDPAGGAGDAALKKVFATAYSGTLTYFAGQSDGQAGQVDVAAATSDRHACIQLTAVLSAPATVRLGRCTLDPGSAGGTGGSSDGITITAATSGQNAQIPVTWAPDDRADGGYTVTCTAALDGDTASVNAPAGADSATVPGVENFVVHTCQVSGTTSAGGTVPAANSKDATPSTGIETTLGPCTNLPAAPLDGTCGSTVEEAPTPPQGLTPMPAAPASGLWGVTSFPSTDADPPHVFYVTGHVNGAVYEVYQAANPVSATSTTVPAQVGYTFAPGTFTAPAGVVTGPSPLTGVNRGTTTLYVVDSGSGPGTGSVWRVDPFAGSRHKVTGGLDNPTEVTGFACYTAGGAKTSGVCLYVATDSGIMVLTLGKNGNAASVRTLSSVHAAGVWLTSAGTLRASVGGTVMNLDPGSGTKTGTAYPSGSAMAGISSTPGGFDVAVDTAAGQIVKLDGTVVASGLDSPRDVHNHQNDPWEYYTTTDSLWMVQLNTGQQVRVWRQPTGGACVDDQFTRADTAYSATGLGSTPDGKAWTQASGSGRIVSNTGQSTGMAVLDLGSGDQQITVTTANPSTYVYFRYQDSKNYWYATYYNGSYNSSLTVFKVINGSGTGVASKTITGPPLASNQIVVKTYGDQILAEWNTDVATITDSALSGATMAGFSGNADRFTGGSAACYAPDPVDLWDTSADGGGVQLSWPVSTDPTVGSYAVYRDGTRIGTEPATAGPMVSFVDTGAASGAVYTYAIRTVNVYGTEGPAGMSQLGGVPATGISSATDDFGRADNPGQLGMAGASGQAWQVPAGLWKISSAKACPVQATSPGAGLPAMTLALVQTGSLNQSVAANGWLTGYETYSSPFGPVLRYASPNDFYYVSYHPGNFSDTLLLYHVLDGVQTQVGGVAVSSNGRVRVTVSGTQFTFWRESSTGLVSLGKVTATDAVAADATRAGFVKLPGSPTPCFDDVDVSGQ